MLSSFASHTSNHTELITALLKTAASTVTNLGELQRVVNMLTKEYNLGDVMYPSDELLEIYMNKSHEVGHNNTVQVQPPKQRVSKSKFHDFAKLARSAIKDNGYDLTVPQINKLVGALWQDMTPEMRTQYEEDCNDTDKRTTWLESITESLEELLEQDQSQGLTEISSEPSDVTEQVITEENEDVDGISQEITPRSAWDQMVQHYYDTELSSEHKLEDVNEASNYLYNNMSKAYKNRWNELYDSDDADGLEEFAASILSAIKKVIGKKRVDPTEPSSKKSQKR